MGVLFCWARPRFLVVLLDLRRNANLAGGFAGRRVLVVRLVYVYLICLRFLILANRAEYHFFHRLCIYQDRATEHLRPNSKKKISGKNARSHGGEAMAATWYVLYFARETEHI